MPVTREEVLALSDKMYEAADSRFESIEKTMKVESGLWDEIIAMAKRAGDGVQIGKLIQFSVADGRASYIILGIKARSVEVVHVPLGDSYHMPYVVSANGTMKMNVARENVRRMEALHRMFGC